MNQQVTFLSGGDSKLRKLQLYLNPNTEYLLDWFHITMRLTVMSQMAKGLNQTESEADIPKQIEQLQGKFKQWYPGLKQAA